MIPDSDAKIWTIKGKAMHLVPRVKYAQSNKEILDWATRYTEGNCITTPTYIAFEHEADAKVFEVMFALTN